MPKEMDELEKAKIYAQCVSLWGIYPQMFMAVEELAELIIAVSKFDRVQANADDVAWEIADVRIMTKQIMHIMGITEDDIKEKEIVKMERLKDRIEKDLERRKNGGKD